MISISVFRDVVVEIGGNYVLQRDVGVGAIILDTATLRQRINSPDVFSVTFGERADVECDDMLVVYNEVYVPDGAGVTNQSIYVGSFRVSSVEIAYGQNGSIVYKVSAMAKAAAELANTGTPHQATIRNADIYRCVHILSSTVAFLGGDGVNFEFVNLSGGEYIVSSENTQTLLDVLGEICIPSQSRWRCRPEIDPPTIQIGRFGELSDVTLRLNQQAIVPAVMPERNVFSFTQVSYISTIDNCPNSLFPEGGMWTDDHDATTPLLLWHYTLVPAGVIRVYTTYPDGGSKFRLDKRYDENLLPILRQKRRSRRLVFGGIVPETTDGGTPSGAQVVAASEILMQAAADYLNSLEDTIKTWTGALPFAFTDKAPVGDKVRLQIIAADGTEMHREVFMVGKTTLWGKNDQTVTTVELSNRLESLFDPVSYNYNDATKSDRSKTIQNQYSDSVSCNPTGTYYFPPGYTAPPAISNYAAVGCTVTIDVLTFEYVTFSISGCVGAHTVTFTVTPPI